MLELITTYNAPFTAGAWELLADMCSCAQGRAVLADGVGSASRTAPAGNGTARGEDLVGSKNRSLLAKVVAAAACFASDGADGTLAVALLPALQVICR
jgi:hypothetical protein